MTAAAATGRGRDPRTMPPMEEKLSVTTGIIGLLAVGGKTIESLWDLNTPANKANAVFSQALQDLKQFRSTIHILYKTFSLLESAQLPIPERGTWIEADCIIATLTDSVLAVSDLQAICEALTLERQGLLTPPPEDVGRGHYEQSIRALCSRLRWHNLSMTMMMTILKCPGESDAQNSRVGLERRMTRLLTANATLADRMRRLEDVFERHSIDAESLPHYTASSRQQFRLPQRAAIVPALNSPSGLSYEAAPSVTVNVHSSPDRDNNSGFRTLSPLSGYTLADVPVLSIIPLPVTTAELVDGNEYYTFAYARRVSRDLGELMQCKAGQGTSRTLGVILGRTMSGVDNGGSMSSTGSSNDNDGCDGEAANTQPTKKKMFHQFRVRRRWRA